MSWFISNKLRKCHIFVSGGLFHYLLQDMFFIHKEILIKQKIVCLNKISELIQA